MWWEDKENIWFKRVFGNLESWLDRGYGNSDFYLTQFFTGHGFFGSYLHRRGLSDTAICILCKEEVDTPEHTFFKCSTLRDERSQLEDSIGERLEVGIVVPRMLENKDIWFKVSKYVRLVLEHKKNENLSADAGPQGSSGVSSAN